MRTIMGVKYLIVTLFLFFITIESGRAVLLNVSGEYKRSNPALLNDFARLNTDLGDYQYSSIENSDTYGQEFSLVARAGHAFFVPFLQMGAFLRYLIPSSTENTAVISGTLPGATVINSAVATPGVLIIKSTTMSGFIVGPFVRFDGLLLPMNLKLIGELGLGWGTNYISQKIETSSQSSLAVSSFASEFYSLLELQYPLKPNFYVGLGTGYSFYGTRVMKVDEAIGSAYGSFKADDKLILVSGQNAKEFTVDLTGYIIQVGFTFTF